MSYREGWSSAIVLPTVARYSYSYC